jgi:hypothetical protein
MVGRLERWCVGDIYICKCWGLAGARVEWSNTMKSCWMWSWFLMKDCTLLMEGLRRKCVESQSLFLKGESLFQWKASSMSFRIELGVRVIPKLGIVEVVLYIGGWGSVDSQPRRLGWDYECNIATYQETDWSNMVREAWIWKGTDYLMVHVQVHGGSCMSLENGEGHIHQVEVWCTMNNP